MEERPATPLEGTLPSSSKRTFPDQSQTLLTHHEMSTSRHDLLGYKDQLMVSYFSDFDGGDETTSYTFTMNLEEARKGFETLAVEGEVKIPLEKRGAHITFKMKDGEITYSAYDPKHGNWSFKSELRFSGTLGLHTPQQILNLLP